jgi:hypothetical protein
MEWDPDIFSRSPMFEPLRPHARSMGAAWPGREALQRLLDRREPPVTNASGTPLRVVAQGRRPRTFRERYEARIFLDGELQVRERSWHDLLNVLVWLAFPRAKAALNARHYAALEAQLAAGARNRGPVQDALTLFDEGGVIVACADAELLDCLRAWRWKELFWTRRAQLAARMRFHLFGHALYEKALRPFPGITGRGIVLEARPEALRAPLSEQLGTLDAGLAAHLADAANLAATRGLEVVPVFGIPGWCRDNDDESFYDDADYFRPARR